MDSKVLNKEVDIMWSGGRNIFEWLCVRHAFYIELGVEYARRIIKISWMQWGWMEEDGEMHLVKQDSWHKVKNKWVTNLFMLNKKVNYQYEGRALMWFGFIKTLNEDWITVQLYESTDIKDHDICGLMELKRSQK